MFRSFARLVQWCSALLAIGGVARATPIPGNSAIAAVATKYDAFEHAFVAQTDGSIREIYFKPDSSAASDVIATIPGTMAISGFSTAINYPGAGLRDRFHVIVGTASGDLYDVYYSPNLGVNQMHLSRVDTSTGATIQALAAWAGDSTVQNVAILMTDGNLFYLRYSDITAPTAAPTLLAPTTATAITGYAEQAINSSQITSHLVILDTDLIDINWPEGDTPDLSNSMTVVNTLESGGPGFQGFAAISGNCRYYRIHDMINLAPSGTTAAALEVVDYTNFEGTLGVPTVRGNGNVIAPAVALASYTVPNDDATMHVISLDATGHVTDQADELNTGEIATWYMYSLGQY